MGRQSLCRERSKDICDVRLNPHVELARGIVFIYLGLVRLVLLNKIFVMQRNVSLYITDFCNNKSISELYDKKYLVQLF